jgi:hypothetical protein
MATYWVRLLLAVRLDEHELKVLERKKELRKFKSVAVIAVRGASVVEAAASEDEDSVCVCLCVSCDLCVSVSL